MVDVDWQSVRLLDSPVVQRLRGICQLGFTYLTYPSAEHSRFAHSLGMYCVASRFLNEMDRKRESNVEPFERWPVPDQDRTDLLHAAILHDVGHMAFSHVSELIFQSFKTEFCCGPFTVEDFIFAVAVHLEKDLSLSECLSLAVVLSPRFQRFYTKFVRPDA
ncbi:MAG: HD domain-containing protein, partial [Nitrososphaera sp.]